MFKDKSGRRQQPSAGNSRARLAPLAAAVAIAAALLSAAPAFAGDYVINNCSKASGSLDSGSWAPVGNSWNTGGSNNICASGGDWIGFYADQLSPSTGLAQVLTAPAGSTITMRHVRVWWRLAHQASGSDTWGEIDANGSELGVYQTPHDSTVSPDDLAVPAGNVRLQLKLDCSNAPGGPCQMGTGTTPVEQVFGVQVTLNSTAAPAGSITGGTMTMAGGRAGNQTVSVHASSPESGIARLEVLLDGTVVGTSDYSANRSLCPFTNFAACRLAVDDTVNADTTKVADGPHTMMVRVTDAAGNSSTINGGLVGVANGSSAAGPTLTIDRGSPNGRRASDRAKIARSGSRWRRVRYGRKATITGRLLDEHGSPIAGATLEVGTRVLLPGAAFAPAGRVTTRSDGSYRVTIAAGPSRYVRIAYRSHAADRGFAAIADVGELVSAAAKLAAIPRHVVNGHRVVFRGRVLGGWIPARGQPVEIQAKVGRIWRDVVAARAGANGKFRASYRFTRTFERVRYVFRAVVRSTSGYPFASGASHPLQVAVN